MHRRACDPNQLELLRVCLNGAGGKEIFFPLSGGKSVKMLNPQWSVTMVSTSEVEMAQENEANTKRDTDTRDREEERLLKVLDPAVPEAQPFLQMGYDSQYIPLLCLFNSTWASDICPQES